jgi:hypothetical protein
LGQFRESPALSHRFRSDIFACTEEFQLKNSGQLRNEGGIGFGFSPTQRVIEVHNRQCDAEIVAQTMEQPQKRDRIGAPRNGYAHTISCGQHSGCLNGCQYGLFERSSHRAILSRPRIRICLW